jgi:hypothetical protein
MKQDTRIRLAKDLFLYTNQTNVEIGESVGVSTRTVANWIDKYEWKALKTARNVSIHNIQAASYRVAEKYMLQLESKVASDAPLDNGDIDSLSKLSRALKNISGDENLSMYIAAFSKFLVWLKSENLDIAKSISPYMNEFQRLKAEELSS